MPHATSSSETYDDFIKIHEEQLVLSGVPQTFWKTLASKLHNEIFDAGDKFMIAKVEEVDEDEDEDNEPQQGDDREQDQSLSAQIEEEGTESSDYSWQVMVKSPDGLKAGDPNQIYLIDHAWTYRVDNAREHLETNPGLLDRMLNLMDIEEDRRNNAPVEHVLSEMWKFNQTYNIGNAELGSESAVPLFYIMDEFGSRIQHSNNPTFKTVPFCYVPRQVSYTLMWPVKDLLENDEVTRDYLGGITDSLQRKIRLLPWQPEDMMHLSFEQHELQASFYNKYKIHETLPNLDMKFPGLAKDRNVKVFSDVDQVKNYLTDTRFEFVDNREEADVIWIQTYLRDFKSFSEDTPHKFINQYPMEMVLTVKDLMSSVARRAAVGSSIDIDTLDGKPVWLQTTFNLVSELPKFVSYFQAREDRELDNHWICKPWNLTRSLDAHITNNLNYILRLPETGPKIACKYIEDPVLIEVGDKGFLKFDFRFVVMVSSVNPLTMNIHKRFTVRVANKAYSLDHLDDFEKHFTVMMYKDVGVIEVSCNEFVSMLESQYPQCSWSAVEASIHEVVKELFAAAVSKPPPMGIADSPQSRAIYGIDVMLKWTEDSNGDRKIQPVILEVNFGPDNSRLCGAYPYFLNDLFSVLFLEDFEGREIVSL